MKLIECVPNFSEGRDMAVLDAIAAEIKSVKGVTLLDLDPGADTNRTVFTMVGEPFAVIDAAFLAIKKASELIDMSKHTGAHPRMGATDVCPFIPVSEVTMEEAVEYAKILAKRVGEELQIPIYLYEYAAIIDSRKNLADVRKGEYEALAEKLKKPEWKPDFGPAKFNSKAGATAISAREFLIAYNINLNSKDKKKASDIAKRIREKGYGKRDDKGKLIKDDNGKTIFEPGFFTHCKAVGWYIEEYQRAQISINLTNYKITPPHIVLEKVRELAAEIGLVVTGSELVGLIPKEALLNAGKFYLNRMNDNTGVPEKDIIETAIQSMGLAELAPFDTNKKVIEYSIAKQDNLINLKINDFSDLLSSDSPAPGGGSVAALCTTMSGALTAMVAALTFGKKGYQKYWEKVKTIADQAQLIKEKSLYAIDKDTDSFNILMEAMKLPKKTEEEIEIRNNAIQEATKKAILVPLETLELSLEAVELARQIVEIGNENALSDAGVAAITALAGAKGAYFNIRINMPGIDNETFREEVLSKSKGLLERISKICTEVETIVESRF